jgi:uncharacterized membrane protein YeaQ/YmgE (transglycosylase-associated protein family)
MKDIAWVLGLIGMALGGACLRDIKGNSFWLLLLALIFLGATVIVMQLQGAQ